MNLQRIIAAGFIKAGIADRNVELFRLLRKESDDAPFIKERLASEFHVRNLPSLWRNSNAGPNQWCRGAVKWTTPRCYA